MPNFTIKLSQKTVDKLTAGAVTRTNEAGGTSYTLLQWLTLHANEIAIADDLPPAIAQLQNESRDTLAAAIRTLTADLIKKLG